MEQKLQNRYGRWGRALCFALALALAALLSLTALPLTGRVYADEGDDVLPGDSPVTRSVSNELDLEALCSLKIEFPEKNEWELKPEDVDVDLYRVAEAVKIPGYNVYGYKLADNELGEAIRAYISGKDDWTIVKIDGDEVFRYTPKDNPETDGWEAMRKLLLKEILVEGKDALSDQTVSMGKEITNLKAGLYLYVPHTPTTALGGNPFVTQVKVKDSDEISFGSIAVSANYVYTFNPQLISLPALEGNVSDTTSGAYWSDDAQGIAKAEVSPRFADVQINKTLSEIQANSSLPVVFTISGIGLDKDGKEVPVTRQVTMDFSAVGKKSETVYGAFLAGRKITVTESYAGPGYKPVSDLPVTIEEPVAGSVTIHNPSNGDRVIIQIGGMNNADFINELADNIVSGSSVVNRFAAEKDPNNNYSWIWYQNGVKQNAMG